MGFDASTTDIYNHLPGPHLTRSWHAFSCAVHHEPPLTAAAHSGLEPPPAGRSRRATQPPSLVQHRSQQTRHHSPEPPPAFVFTSSAPITGASSLLRAGPPARAATVLSASRFQPPSALPVASPHHTIPVRVCGVGTRLPTFRAEAADQAHAASMPDTAWPVNGLPPGSSRSRIDTPVSMSFPKSRHVISGSLAFVFLIPI